MVNKYFSTRLLLFLLTAFSCNYKELTLPGGQVIVGISNTPASIPADGVSKSKIKVELPFETADDKRSVVFTTTRGLFDIEGKNTTTVNAIDTMINGVWRKIAQAVLVSTLDTNIAIVSVKVQNYLFLDTVPFTIAFPDIIHLMTDKLTYKPDVNAELTLTVQIQRNPGYGTPSTGQTITLTALDNMNNPIGKYRNLNLLTDATGKVVNYFSIPVAPSYNSPITISASVYSSAATKLPSDPVVITVIK